MFISSVLVNLVPMVLSFGYITIKICLLCFFFTKKLLLLRLFMCCFVFLGFCLGYLHFFLGVAESYHFEQPVEASQFFVSFFITPQQVCLVQFFMLQLHALFLQIVVLFFCREWFILMKLFRFLIITLITMLFFLFKNFNA